MKKLIDFILENQSLKQSTREKHVFDEYTIYTYWPKENDNDKTFIRGNKFTLFNFLNDGYNEAGLGDFKGCSDAKHLARNASCVRICTQNETDEIIALGVYTDYRQGNKAVGYTVTTDKYLRDLGIKALNDIIKLDIQTTDKYYWSACSGAIEHLYLKHNAIMIPNIFIDNYYDLSKVHVELINDGFHFFEYDKNDDKYEKVIFGFNSKETFDKVNKELEDKIFNSIEHSDNLNEKYSDLSYVNQLSKKLAVFIDYVEFDGLQELPKRCYDYFKELINECDVFIAQNPDFIYSNETFKHNLETVKESMQEITILTYQEYKQ